MDQWGAFKFCSIVCLQKNYILYNPTKEWLKKDNVRNITKTSFNFNVGISRRKKGQSVHFSEWRSLFSKQVGRSGLIPILTSGQVSKLLMNSACRHILWLSFESTSHKYKMRSTISSNLFNDYEKKSFTIIPKVGNSQGLVALNCSSGVLRVLLESPDCGHSNLTNGLKLLQHLEKKKEGKQWLIDTIHWFRGQGEGGNRMPRVKDWQKPGQANKSEIATFFPNFHTFLHLLGRCLGIPPSKGFSFVENAPLAL